MSARLPLLHKTPFILDERPLLEATSAHAGALSVARAFRSLGLPELIDANLNLRKRQRGFSEGQFIESICLLQTIGGECPEDMRLLGGDECLERGLGYEFPKVTAVREFTERFHDRTLETPDYFISARLGEDLGKARLRHLTAFSLAARQAGTYTRQR